MFYTIIRAILWVFLNIFFRVKVIGKFNPIEDEKYVITSNHQSMLDPIILGVIFKQKMKQDRINY